MRLRISTNFRGFFVLRVSEHRRWDNGLKMKQWWNNGEGVEVNQRGGWWEQKQWWSLIQTSITSSVCQTNEDTRAKVYFNRLSGLSCTCVLCLTSYLHSLNRLGWVFFYIMHYFFHLFMKKILKSLVTWAQLNVLYCVFRLTWSEE